MLRKLLGVGVGLVLGAVAALVVAWGFTMGRSSGDLCPASQGPSGDGCLIVVQRIRGGYVEGAFSYLTVTGDDTTQEAELNGASQGTRVAILRLPPGEYDAVSYQRPCLGSCPPEGSLDPPRDECMASFILTEGGQVTVEVDVMAGVGCTIEAGP